MICEDCGTRTAEVQRDGVNLCIDCYYEAPPMLAVDLNVVSPAFILAMDSRLRRIERIIEDADIGPAGQNDVANKHVIYAQPCEGLSLNDSEWWEEAPAYKLHDYTEGMAG